MKKLFLFFYLFTLTLIFSQDVELNRINAKDEFKWGVKFFNQGLYEKSVFSFERSLSFDSTDLLTHEWLGRAYFMKGDIDAAFDEWSILKENQSLPLWLEKNMEIISAERGVINKLYKPEEWVTLYTKEIERPTSLLSLENGKTAIVSFLGNKIEIINANGAITETFNGGFDSLNRPFDIIKDDNDGYIVSEFMGDKISFINSLGVKTKSINIDVTPLAGPGHLTRDNSGYFYASDWGNRRVCKFDMDGNYILSIKDKNLIRPSGVLADGDIIYISDYENKTLLMYDSSGNYIKTLVSLGLDSPEGLSFKNKSSILIADGLSIKEYNLESGILSVLSDLQSKANKITKAIRDVNGNTLALDFNQGQFYALTDLSTLYGGLYTIIDKIVVRNFPKIEVEFQVYNRLGEPLVGLDNSNFLVTENNKVVPTRNVVFSGNSNSVLNIGLIFDMNSGMEIYKEVFYDIAKTLEDEISTQDEITILKAGQIPEILDIEDGLATSVSGLVKSDFMNRQGIDQTIKLAASSVIKSRAKRSIILVTNGIASDNDYDNYSLGEIKDFLVNNRITFSVLYTDNLVNEELEYLVNESKGESRFLFSNKGAKGITDIPRRNDSGFYVIEFESLKNINNGEAYTTVEIETNYIRKSGRNEAGYYVPVKVVN